MKFATKLFFLCLGSVLSVILPIYLFLYYVGIHTIEHQIEHRLYSETTQVMTGLDRMLFEKVADVKLMASDHSIRNHSSAAEIAQRLIEYRNQYIVYSSISFFDNNRIRIADTAGFSLGQPADDSLWAKDVFEYHRISAGNDIHFDSDIKGLVLFLAVPAKDVNGNHIGAVVARILVEKFHYLFNELNEKLKEESSIEEFKPHIDLINQSGLLIYSNYHYSKLGQQADFLDTKEFMDDRFIHTIAQEQGYLGFKGNHWTLVVRYPKAAAFTWLNQLRNQAIAMGIVLLMLVIVAIFFVARRMIRPIIALRGATLQLGKGHFEITVPVMSKDEIGELAVSFNQMVQLIKQSKEELRQQEEFLRLVIDNIPQMILWKDTNSVYLGCNSKVSQMNQLKSVDDIVGKTDFELVWKEFAPLYVEDDRQVMQAKKPKLNFVEQIVNEDGTPGWLRTNKIPLCNAQGTVVGILATAENITNQIQAEQLLKQYNQTLEAEVAKRTEELRKSEERFDLAMRGATDGLWDWNVETNEMYFSPRWKSMLGYEEHEIKDDFNAGFGQVHPDDVEIVSAEVQAYLEKKIPKYEMLFRMRHKDGHYRWILSRAVAVWNAEGKAVRVVGTHVDMTAQKQAEQALRESEQKFTRLFMEVPIPMGVNDDNNKILHINHQFVKLFGYTLEDISTLDEWWQFAYPDETYRSWVQEKWNATVTRAVEQNTIAEPIEYEITCRNGMRRTLLVSGIPLGANFLATFVDITERKQAEEALRKSQQSLAEAQRLAHVGNWEWEIQTGALIWSDEVYRIFGVQPGEFEPSYETVLNFVHPDDVADLQQSIEDALHGKKTYSIDHRIILPNNELRFVHGQGEVHFDEKSQPARIAGIIQNITERKQNEESLRLNEERFRSYFEMGLVGMAYTSLEKRWLLANDYLCQLLGYPWEELQQKTWAELTHLEDLEADIQQFNRMLRGEIVSYSLDKRFIRKDGEIIYTTLSVGCVRNADGKINHIVALIQDITKRKRAEIALQEAKEIAEQARQQADIANQSKSTFLANMSHELRTPLNGILGYTQILSRDKTITPKQQDGINIIHRSGEYLLTLINDILDLSKIEAGKVELYLTNINFPEFIRGISELFQMRAQQKGINFIYEPLSRLPLGIKADEKRLRQVLINLLGNAVKFTEQGGVNLKIGYQGDKIRFQIEDTGVGIAAEDIEKIFQPFQQAGDHHHKAEGTGLGLSITKKLIEMMGGKLHVESQLGHGSKFWMELDLPETSELIKTDKEQPPTIIGFEGQPRRLLVIDDKWANRSVMINLLTPLGFEIVEAENGQEGLQKAYEQEFDLIITDLVMPVMDGFEVVRQMRKVPQLENMPIIAASASVFDYHQQQSKAAGCDDFMPKPFRAEMLFELLQKHLNLTWIYAEEVDSATTTSSKPVPIVDMPFIGPSAEQASTLLDLAMMGDISGVLNTLNQLEKEDSKYLPFIEKVRQLAKNFDEEQICEMMQQYTN